MEMPGPGPDHQRLHALAGKWSGEETMHPGPMGPGRKSQGFTDARISPDGFWLISEYHQKVGAQITFHGHGVIGWDSFGKRYLWYWVDSMGMPPPTATAGKFHGNEFRFESETPHGKTRYVFTLQSADSYQFRIETSPDGGKTWTPFMDGNYKRVK